MRVIKLRGSLPRRWQPYELGEIPQSVLQRISRQLVHRLAIGHEDLDGDDFGTIFARAVDGEHRAKPLGLADVILNGVAWSIKTVSHPGPFEAKRIRLISGRNAPVFSTGLANPFESPQETGNIVLSIWNSRVDEALASMDELRCVVLIRNFSLLQFAIFEEEVSKFVQSNYFWSLNRHKNLVAVDSTGRHCFTWQPSGGQFTRIVDLPGGVRRFFIEKRPPTITEDEVLAQIGYQDGWVSYPS